MEARDVLREYFLNIENDKNLECGNFPEAEDLMNKVKNNEYWNYFIVHKFNFNDLQEFFTNKSSEIRNDLFKFGISCFVRFIQANFTGPALTDDLVKLIENPELASYDFYKMLTVNHEEINANIKYPVLLVISKCIFEKCLVVNIVINTLWSWRCLMIHQQILDELSPLLLSQADTLYKQIETINLEGFEKAKFDIEFAQLYLTFRHVGKAKEHIQSADDILGVEYNLQGKLGKRTKYQEKDIAQLTLEISLIDKPNISRPPVHKFHVPTNITLKDDVRLDKIKFVDGPQKIHELPNTEQKLFLTRIQEMLIGKPQDDLQKEEIEPFIDLILNQNNTWSVRLSTLFLRSKIEVKFRTLERTLAQCREILHSYEQPKPHVLNRVGDVFGTGLMPMWKAEAQCADVLLNMGLVKHALDIYKKIKLWEEVIVCYTLLKLRHKAAEVIREQLVVKETVKMWCLLGDATDDVSCYERAWELSKKRSHRAQRHWGNFLYSRKEYQECIPHFEKSVSINPLQAQVWLRLGYAALQTENWQIAATAYRRYTNLEPDGFQAWNNLAQAYIKIGNKRSAHQSLLEALKYNFDNWKIWENLLVVSCDIYHLSNIIRAYHKLLDLKGKYLNYDALNVLVYNVGDLDSNEEKKTKKTPTENSENLLQKTRELLGRITSIYPGEGYVWEMYASLVPPSLLRAQRLQRAFRAYTQTGWDKNQQICVQVMCLCIKLAELVLTKNIDAQNTLLNSVKLNLSSALTAIKKHDWDDTKSLVVEVSTHLEKLIEKIKNISEQQLKIGDIDDDVTINE